MYDILIKNGLVIDGTNSLPSVKDIAINQDSIAEIAENIPVGKALVVIDAVNKFVAPGFIDVTSHSDTTWSIFDYPGQESMLTQGVTTIVGGNCGSSLAPLGNNEAIKSIQKWTDLSKINTNWSSVSEFLHELSSRQLGVNFGTLLGHGTMRRGIIGDAIRPLNIEEIEKIKYLTDQGMKDGAFGVSTGLGNSHEQAASADEVMNFVRLLKAYGGIYKPHLRSEGREGLLAAINEVVRIGRETEVPVCISHLKAIGRSEWSYIGKTLEMLKNAEEDGVTIRFDIFPYLRTGSHLYQLLPRWSREGGFAKIFERIKSIETREKVISDLKRYTLHYDRIIVASAKNPAFAGKTILQIAISTNLRPEEALVELLLINEGRISIFNKNISAKNLLRLILSPNSMIATDGAGYSLENRKTGNLVHPRSFGTFVHFLHHFVRQEGRLTWEQAITKISSLPATTLGIKNRGFLKKKFFADVVVFDPMKLADTSTFRSPYSYSTGIDWVVVNGKIAVSNGEITSSRAGRVLKK
ncbi:MAG: hypothetical protein A3H69_03505 [Candidatus Sungbacteria bacterium RIFCSPLOWO2_02_FULL_47_9]|uniref:Amidohydrolase-related domain-containing protein n=1 Tax=Candidatus Sungbacteria bacterium RIFCSPHIGHO2_01_FULL_47_32 TaxID=1802264 RepID=A0A1G2K4U4_9BACT|nr:MAG: N-acyl-D-amino-acid deacylase [Parcubacteria group bacterium GW2011_GWA2_47_10]OGZ93621.1 MAG: hypothetical protein A2633_04680 [Candidatus Sungbacteria bacterium RIFCSPHIGHO2_01_FULL_47_32]OHA05462.1 MAG: hypothetical protein A3A28_03140 [Candidatus Sungbacteria bacterium RIFCSPLOWO2_01_FULL_47_32]OHA11587.1 MAG: hypothetical protein A3H69_03505 [Candidatus Sungbacteria bacterium RIFCSPLOWO2_02_FULL_47_9]